MKTLDEAELKELVATSWRLRYIVAGKTMDALIEELKRLGFPSDVFIDDCESELALKDVLEEYVREMFTAALLAGWRENK